MRRLALATLVCVAFAASDVQAQTPAAPAAVAPPAVTAPTTVIREPGLVADYYAADPAKASRGAVIVLGGSEGGLQGSRPIARRLAAEGLDAIAVSYFGEPGQSATLNLTPIEPVGRAVDWLLARLDGTEPIALVGASKGAELALLHASRDPRIAAVAVGTPSNVTWQGIDMTGGPTGSSWTSGDQPLPFAAYDMSNGFQGVYKLYADSLTKASPEAEIAVERIAGPVLLVASRDDGLWPAVEMIDRITARLTRHDFAHPVETLIYDTAGHAVFGTPIASVSPGMAAQFGFLGGTAEGLVAARAEVWPKVVSFLKTALAD